MSLTTTKQLKQTGRKFYAWGVMDTDSVATDSGTLLDFSADIDNQPQGASGPIYTALKIRRLMLSSEAVTTVVNWLLSFDATTDVAIINVAGRATPPPPTVLDYSTSLDGGIVDPKGAGYTGDLFVDRTVLAGGNASDRLFFYVEGELIP